jgi:hypothetical protein
VDALAERLDWLYYGLGIVVALLPAAPRRALGGAGLCLLGLAAAADRIGGAPGATTFVTVNEILAAAGGLLVLVAALLRRPRQSSGPGQPVSALPGSRTATWIALILAATGVTAGALLAVALKEPGGGYGVAAESALAVAFGGAALTLAGVPPLHRVSFRTRLAPLSLALLLGIVLPRAPLGLLVWQVPAMVLLCGALWAAILLLRFDAALVAAGFLAIAGGQPDGVVAGAVLAGWGWLVGIGSARPSLRLPRRWTGLLALPAIGAALPAFAGVLRAQVTLPVAAALGSAAALIAIRRRLY